MQSPDLSDHLSDDIISKFENGSDLDEMISGEIFHQDSLYMRDNEDENELDDIIVLHMDIREPLSSLKFLLEQKVGVMLKKYTFWLQNTQILEPHKNLVDQCVKGEGLVQINVQIQTTDQKINIVDVLKPTEAALAAIGTDCDSPQYPEPSIEDSNDSTDMKPERLKSPVGQDASQRQRPCLNWVLDSKFKKEQLRLKIPEDPNDWTVPHVKHWLQWAVRQFNLVKITLSQWNITGATLCLLTHEEFRRKVPVDPGNVFWTHLQLLKECKFVSIVHQPLEMDERSDSNTSPLHMRVVRKQQYCIRTKTCYHDGVVNGSGGTNTNGPVQLWQFLLEILTDREHRNIIQWVGTEGEFKLIDPEQVATLWGEKKNKPAMNYEKLSRALRYYYDGDMISKVSGKRFAYKFDCDLKLLIGYDAGEISRLVNERKPIDDYMEPEYSESEEEE